jgi:hypothetical protein
MSTLELKELSHPSGEVIKIASGKTLDLNSQGTLVLPTVPHAKMPSGSVLQVVQLTSAARITSTTINTWYNTNNTLSITPQFANSKILVTVTQPAIVRSSGTEVRGGMRLNRTTTNSVIWNEGDFRESIMINGAGDVNEHGSILHMEQLDSPNSTSAVTYTVQANLIIGTLTILEYAYGARMTLMEIAG